MSQRKYLKKPASECIKYIESFGHSIDSLIFFKTTPSGSGIVYKLENNKVVLIPSDFNLDYPGFIFESEYDLDEMIKSNFYPIDEKHMTVWEVERKALDSLPKTVDYFKTFLLSELKYEKSLKNLENFKSLYNLLVIEVKNSKPLWKKEKLMISFGILLMNFFVETQSKNKWHFKTRYETYNSYKYPILQSKSEMKDIIQLVFISVADDSSDFDFLFNSIVD